MSINPINETIPIELVYGQGSSEERIVVQFPNGLKNSPVFGGQDKYLEEAMKTTGIPIPIDKRTTYPEFKNKERQSIFLKDSSFGKAFYEIYFPQKMNPNNFQWRKL